MISKNFYDFLVDTNGVFYKINFVFFLKIFNGIVSLQQ